MRQPINIKDKLLTEDREVVRPLFRGRDNHDLLVGIVEQNPEYERSSDPGFSNPTKG